MRYFLGIIGILGFCDFVIFPSHPKSLPLNDKNLVEKKNTVCNSFL